MIIHQSTVFGTESKHSSLCCPVKVKILIYTVFIHHLLLPKPNTLFPTPGLPVVPYKTKTCILYWNTYTTPINKQINFPISLQFKLNFAPVRGKIISHGFISEFKSSTCQRYLYSILTDVFSLVGTIMNWPSCAIIVVAILLSVDSDSRHASHRISFTYIHMQMCLYYSAYQHLGPVWPIFFKWQPFLFFFMCLFYPHG